MLTEEARTRLKAEETFRYEVRKSLEKKEKKKFWPKTWELANSAFGLWLLSTVVVGLVASSYSSLKATNEINSANSETRRKLVTETSSRLQVFRAALVQIEPEGYYIYNYKQIALTPDGSGGVDESSASRERAIFVFPEFKDRTLQSLLFEIEHLTKDQKEAAVIRNAWITVGRIKNTLLTLPDRPSPQLTLRQQYLIQSTQISPNTKLSPSDSVEMSTYNQQLLKQNEELSNYRAKMKLVLDSLSKELLKNSFLKEQIEGKSAI